MGRTISLVRVWLVVVAMVSVITACSRAPVVSGGVHVNDPFIVRSAQTINTTVLISSSIIDTIRAGVDAGTVPISIAREAHNISGRLQIAIVVARNALVAYMAGHGSRSGIYSALDATQVVLSELISLLGEHA